MSGVDFLQVSGFRGELVRSKEFLKVEFDSRDLFELVKKVD